MSARVSGFLTWGLVVLLAGAVSAHNDEYRPPRQNPPPQAGRGTVVTPGSRIPARTPPPREGATTRGSRDPAATPGSVRQLRAISWELVWELLRRGEPEPPPAPSAAAAARARAALVGAVGDESSEVRAWAALALGRAGELDAVLAALREHPELFDTVGVLGAGLAARRRGDEEAADRAIAALGPLLRDPEVGPNPRALAAVAAGFTGSRAAGALLTSYLRVGHEDVRAACLLALGMSRHPGAGEVLVDAALPPKRAGSGPDAPAHRVLAVHALTRLPGAEPLAHVVRRLADGDPVVRSAAALSLADRLEDTPAGRLALRDLAARDDPGPRSAALLALTLAGDETAAGLARTALADRAGRASGLNALAALCLGLLRSARDGPALLFVAADEEAESGLRAACALAAGLARARGGAERLGAILADARDARLVGHGVVGLALLDGRAGARFAGRALAHEKRTAVRRRLVTALGYAGGEEAVDALAKALGDEYAVNREAARALFRADPDRAVKEVLARLGDERDTYARRFAAIALGSGLDRDAPTIFATTLLGTAISGATFPERLFLYLEDEGLVAR